MRERGEAMRCETRRGEIGADPPSRERASNHPSTARSSRRSFSLASRARCESPREAPLLRRASRPEGAHGIERARARARRGETKG